MENELNINDLKLIITSLEYTRLNFQDYKYYPSEDYRKQRIDDVNRVINKVKTLKDSFKDF